MIIPCFCGGASYESSHLVHTPYKYCFRDCNEHIWPLPGTPEFLAAVEKAKPAETVQQGRVYNFVFNMTYGGGQPTVECYSNERVATIATAPKNSFMKAENTTSIKDEPIVQKDGANAELSITVNGIQRKEMKVGKSVEIHSGMGLKMTRKRS